jgi:hypothetical protein
MGNGGELLAIYQYGRNIPLENFEKWFDTPIYRIMPIEYVLHIFEHNELYFPNICKHWEDPYELFVYKQDYTYQGYKLDNSDVLQHHYGQCWSTRMNSDALWRIYSPDMKSVRLKTTPRLLLQTLYNNKNDEYVINYGPVRYLKRQEIEDWLKINFSGSFSDKYVIESFFMKRNNFSHEDEVRIIISTPTIQNGNKINPVLDGVTIKIDPNHLIKQIAFDPRLPENRCKIFKQMFKRYGNPDIKYVKSSYYTMKPLSIEI